MMRNILAEVFVVPSQDTVFLGIAHGEFREMMSALVTTRYAIVGT
jgi:hypothetical protein